MELIALLSIVVWMSLSVVSFIRGNIIMGIFMIFFAVAMFFISKKWLITWITNPYPGIYKRVNDGKKYKVYRIDSDSPLGVSVFLLHRASVFSRLVVDVEVFTPGFSSDKSFLALDKKAVDLRNEYAILNLKGRNMEYTEWTIPTYIEDIIGKGK